MIYQALKKLLMKLFIVPDSKRIYHEQLINSNELLTIIPAKNRYENVYSRIIFWKVDGSVKHLVFNMMKDKELKTTEFSGKIYLTTLEGNYINAYKIENGATVIRYTKPKILQENVQARGGDDCWGIACGMEGDEIYIEGPSRGSNGSMQPKDDDSFGSSDGSWGGWYYGSGETGNDNTGGGGNEGGDEEGYEIINELTGKALCVYEKLGKSNSKLFQETIGTFIDDPKYNLIFKKGKCGRNAAACTNSQNISLTGEVVIIIDQLSGSVLEDAAMFLHEGIHAEIARYVQRHKTGEDPNNRARMFQLYKFYKESEVPEEHLDHPYMTLNYINPIATALRRLDGNKYPLDYYKSFAWDGLRKWDVANLLGTEQSPEFEAYRVIVNAITTLSCE